MRNLKYGYVIIERASDMCVQTMKTNNAKFAINNDAHFSMPVPVETVGELLEKFFYNGGWWTRVWSAYDEFGNPAEGASYQDIPFTVGGEG